MNRPPCTHRWVELRRTRVVDREGEGRDEEDRVIVECLDGDGCQRSWTWRDGRWSPERTPQWVRDFALHYLPLTAEEE